MAIKLVSSGGGSVTIADPASTASNYTLNPPLVNGNLVSTGDTATVTPAMLSQKLTQGTAVASTSGTAIDFTGIPSWVKRITLMFNGISKSASSNFLVQLGTGGVPTTSGYTSGVNYIANVTGASVAWTTGFGTTGDAIGSATISGNLVFTNLSGNIWTGGGVLLSPTPTLLTMQIAGIVTLSGSLNMVRITTVNGTDTFDAGSINILYEG